MSATHFRKKPVVIEAVQYTRRFWWPDWFHDAVTANRIIPHGTGKFASDLGPCFCEIKTLEGVMRAREGDWIIKGIAGEIYPCKADIFAATYEPVGAADALSRLEAENERLRGVIQNVLDGNYPSPRDHRPGKCAHGVFYWHPCENCVDEYLNAALSPPPPEPDR